MTRLVPAICLIGLLLAGCGGDGDTKTVTETRTEAPATESATAAAIPTGNHGPRYFETPSHNIGCYVDARAARCDIRSRTWSPPPDPASCKKIGLDYGQGVVVGAHRSEFVCAGDTSLGGRAVLPYGGSTRRGMILCVSRSAGMTCRNTAIGHGFFLSRQRYRLF